MSEYWKSTPKYWCKHCGIYVRDTKLERTNHESTGKHQGAVKRALRDLHRTADQKEREKERVKREIERLNGVVSGTPSSSSSAPTGAKKDGGLYKTQQQPQQLTEAERQRQLEQLAELGVSIPDELRGSMALAGEWTVVSTKVIDESSSADTNKDESKESSSRAIGVKRERVRTEEEKEQEEALNGLFKRPRKWGIDSKRMPTDEDAELDALLSGPLVKTKKEETEEALPIKKEESEEQTSEAREEPQEDKTVVKNEPDVDEGGIDDRAIAEAAKTQSVPDMEELDPATSAPAVVFKKRKPKNVRQK